MRRVTLRGLLARKLRLALTALAIVLGVTFVTATLVFADTLDRTLNNLVDKAYQHVSFEIRGKAAFSTNTPAGVDGGPTATGPGVDRRRGAQAARRRLCVRIGRRLRPVHSAQRHGDREGSRQHNRIWV